MGDAGDREPFLPLPSHLANPRQSARVVFDQIADLYDSARPGYADAAVAALTERSRLGPPSVVLEIGCGTGQLTRSLAPTGARLRCLEPGPSLARLAAGNLARFPNVEVVQTSFEDADDNAGTFDLLVSATAFHWIDPNVGYPKAANLLRRGGSLGLLTNAHGAGGSETEIAGEVQALHRELAPDVGAWTFPRLEEIEETVRRGGDIASVWHRLERKFETPPAVGELFEPPFVAVYPWLAEYDTGAYLAVLASQSTYALMEPPRRAALLARIGELVEDRLDGQVTKQYATVLALARKA